MSITGATALRDALQNNVVSDIDIHLTAVPRDTARQVLELLEMQEQGGAVVLPIRAEYTPNQVAKILGISRPQVLNLIKQGHLAHRMVGSHRRISVASVTAFQAQRNAAQLEAMAELTRVSNELGLTG